MSYVKFYENIFVGEINFEKCKNLNWIQKIFFFGFSSKIILYYFFFLNFNENIFIKFLNFLTSTKIDNKNVKKKSQLSNPLKILTPFQQK